MMNDLVLDLNFSLGEFTLAAKNHLPLSGVTLLRGESGSGKTTLLRTLAGVEPKAIGEIIFKGKKWLSSREQINVLPEKRRVALVNQKSSLFPHWNVRKNLEFAWKRSGKDRLVNLEEYISEAQLAPLLDRFPHKLSGGERQRVALVRAMVRAPDLLLLDEPLNSLNLEWREIYLKLLKSWQNRYQIPVLLVSHSNIEEILCPTRTLRLVQGKFQ